jgi:ABC-type multidrug transport system fused ATPase/permease subunit
MNIFGVYRQLLGLLDKKEAIKLRLLFVLMLLTGLVDMAGVASIMPFMTVLASPEMVNTNPYLQQAYVFVGANSIDQFFLILGGFVFVVFVGSLVLKAVNAYAMLRFTSMRSHSLSCKLLQTYLAQPYPFFLQRNTSDLSKIMFSDVADVVSNMLFPLLRLVASSIVAVLILSLLLVVEPWVTLVSMAVLGGFFGTIFLATRKYLNESGKHFVANNSTRFILANEALNLKFLTYYFMS